MVVRLPESSDSYRMGVVALILGLVAFAAAAGCSEPGVSDPEDAGEIEEDAGDVGDDEADVEEDVDTGPPPETNPCGGEEQLQYDGTVPVEPGDECGPCGEGVLVCDGSDEVTCVGAGSENACGGCGWLEGQPDEPCGPCGEGAWTCTDDGDVECQGATELNSCGGCEQLDETPQTACELSDRDGIWQCTGANELTCVDPRGNACGGEGELDARPGDSCGSCNEGVVICEGTESTRCHGAERGANECGGCAPLEGQPDDACGQCDGEWYCGDDEFVVCDDNRNQCGGCLELIEETPGEFCSGGARWMCDGVDHLTCPDGTDEPLNACGGTEDLDARPGEVCGECGDGFTVCTTPNEVICHGARDLNECGGCGLLAGQEGESCATGGTWECTEEGTMRCEIDDDGVNACGGTEPLEASPGQECGPCQLDVYVCDGADAVECSGSTPCPDVLGESVEVSDVQETSATFQGEIDELPPLEITDHGFCWDDEPDPGADEANCESLGTVQQAGSFSTTAEGLEPGTEYYVQAFATTTVETDYSDETDFWTKTAAPAGVEATDDNPAHVTISWEEVDGADGYIVRRNGDDIASVDADTTFHEDDDADEPSVEPPPFEYASTNRADGVELFWHEPSFGPGQEYDYEVTALNLDGLESEPGSDSGRRGATEIDHYEICRGASDGCDEDEWIQVDPDGELTYLDEGAPKAPIDNGEVTASQGEYDSYVELTARQWEVGEAESRRYTVRAVLGGVSGPESTAREGQRRADTDIEYEWFGSDPDSPGDFVSLIGPAGDADSHRDQEAPDDGTEREYYLELTATGAETRQAPDPSDPLVGYTAAPAEVETLEARDDDIGFEEATLRGLHVAEGIPATTELGICWNLEEPAEQGECRAADELVEPGEEFAVTFEGLEPGMEPVFRAYAETENAGTSYGDHESFKTREVSADHSSITGEDGTVADGIDSAEITIELRDDRDDPVVGERPEFEASGEPNSYESCPETDSDGISVCAMSSTAAGSKTLEITEPVETTGESIGFVACDEQGVAYTDGDFGGGDGSAESPYRICSAEQLGNAGGYPSDDFLMTSDVDMSGVDDFDVIGDEESFTGTFDGGGFAVENLEIDRPTRAGVGMFGVVGESGTVRDLEMTDIDVRGGEGAGALVGVNHGEVADIEANSQVEGHDWFSGGLVGENYGTVRDSSVESLVTVVADEDDYAWGQGGLVGTNQGLVRDCEVTGLVVGWDGVGGVAGDNRAEMDETSSEADVEGDNSQTGGLVGWVSEEGEVVESRATGTVDAAEDAGGLVGWNSGVVSRSRASGLVDSQGEEVGGLVGVNQGEVADSLATGDVEAAERVAGLIGRNRTGGVIRDSYSTGAPEGAAEVGGLVGNNDGEVEDSYWDEQTSGIDEESDDSGAGTALETADFQEENFPGAWDFDQTWEFGTDPAGDERPLLQWTD